MSNVPNHLEQGPEDVNPKIKNIRSLGGQPLEASKISHYAATTSRIEMLAARVKVDPRNASKDIVEIVVLCRELVTSDISGDHLTSAFEALTQAVLDDFSSGKRSEYLDQAIGCLRGALNASPPGFYQLSLNLSNLLVVRFLAFQKDDDYQEANAVLHNITHPPSPRAPPDPYQVQGSALTSVLGLARSLADSNLKDWDDIVSRCRSFLENLPNFGHPLHPVIAEVLTRHAERVSKKFSAPEAVQAPHSEIDRLRIYTQLGTFGNWVESDVVQTVPSLTAVEEKIKRLRHLRAKSLQGTDRQRKYLKDLVRCYDDKVSLTKDPTDITEAIKYRRILLATTHPTDPSTFFHLASFGNFLYLAFNHTKRADYLDESISRHREVLQLDSARQTHFITIRRLIDLLSIRWKLFGRRLDLDEAMCLFASGVENSYTTVPSQFELACRWAYTARIFRHPSVLTAYTNAMSLMQESLVFVPKPPIQNNNFEKHDLYEKTALNFASHQFRAGQVERGIEALEQGRALLWSEMRGLRTSTDQLRTADPVLTDRFTAINQELEILITSASSNESVGMMGGEFEGEEWMVQSPGLMAKQQELLEERDALISRIRGLSGLENFLLPVSFDTLRSAASHGLVIMINHCKWRSDIIIILHDSPPSLVTTPHNFFGRANRLKEKLLGIRQRCGPDSSQYARTLASVLSDLYELVGEPVIKRLNELGIPEQSRVWWCPTSAFGYLPLHAMGPIPSAGKEKRYFSDMYISSYTPTLSSLITSRNSHALNPGLPNILLVALPDPSLPGISGEIQAIEGLNLPVTSLISRSATPSTVLDGLRKHQFFHFACRGASTAGKPFDASIILYEEKALMVHDIVRSRLPAGECAFLATCHTAELSDGSMADEALYLSAAVQYSGFRSVIGTMWAMVDEDGQYAAKYFYESMFSDERQGVPYHERSAMALAFAVRRLRERGVSLERWVNYTHFGV
jgi:hypothetical protein